VVKLVYCLRRRADVAPEEFHRYWLEEHGPKVKSAAAALRARRYVQSHTTAPELNAMFVASRGLGPAYDGITEVWWDSVDDVTAALATPEGAASAAVTSSTESRFIDFARSSVFMTTEHAIF